MEHESDGDTDTNWCSWYSCQRSDTVTGEHGNNRASGDYQKYSIIEVTQNTGKSNGVLRWLADTQNPLKIHHLTLMEKNPKGVTIIVMKTKTPQKKYQRKQIKCRVN